MEKFSENIGRHYYGETGMYRIEHNIINLSKYTDFQDIVFENLYDNDIYNVYFEYSPEIETKINKTAIF